MTRRLNCILMRRRTMQQARRGSLYVAVMGVAMIVAMIGLAGMHLAKIETRSYVAVEAVGQAQIAANSAAEIVIAQLLANSNWRTAHVNNQETPAGTWQVLDSVCSYKYVLSDADGSLADDANDAAALKVIARSGAAVSCVSVQLEPAGMALDCLNVAAHAAGRLRVDAGTVTCNQTISSNDDLENNTGASVASDAWSAKAVKGSFTGTVTQNATPQRSMPDSTDAFTYYLANATPIPIGSIPSATISGVVLSASNNPYGSTNPQGLYYIDAGTTQLTIRNSRIKATLIVRSSMPVVISQSINWSPAAPNYPALMIDGELQMAFNAGAALSELTLLTNFNPAHTPYQEASDADLLDTYPCEIEGLIYATDRITINNQSSIRGIIVSGEEIRVNANLNLTYFGAARDYPPPGFTGSGGLRVVPGSWKRVAR